MTESLEMDLVVRIITTGCAVVHGVHVARSTATVVAHLSIAVQAFAVGSPITFVSPILT